MKPYAAILSVRFRMLLQYRAAAFAGFTTQIFWGLIRLMIFEAFYRSSNAPEPMTLSQVATYIWLSQAAFALLPSWVEADARAAMRTGTVAYELLRPLDLYGFWFFRSLAARTAPTVLRSIPLVVLAWLFFGLSLPASPAAGMAWAAAMVAAALLSSAIVTLMTISMLWTIAGEGVAQLIGVGVWLFSGILIPLPFFPDWLQPLLNVLPFRGLLDVPFRIYSGHIPPSAILLNLGGVVLWTVVLVFAGRLAMARGVRRLVVQGG